MKKWPLITLDGPAGVGKTTLARRLAQTLERPYLDTGAMYRVLALHIEDFEDLDDKTLKTRCAAFRFTLEGHGDSTILLCNGEPLDERIRTEEIGQRASRLASHAVVRTVMTAAQRKLGKQTPLVVEGRDMGTVVFPQAQYKFFLDADAEIRAERRFLELQTKGRDVEQSVIAEQVRTRDEQDRTRAVAPLKAANDAIMIDTTLLSIEEVLTLILDTVQHTQTACPTSNNEAPSSVTTRSTVKHDDSASASKIFSHLDDNGNITMVDVTPKGDTLRVAKVRAAVRMHPSTLALLKEKALPKGDVLVTAKIAGIMAAKRTAEMIPLCHPLPIDYADVRFALQDSPPTVHIEAEVRATHRTGVEMEAMMAAQVAAATIYDMCKAVQRDMVIDNVRLVYKAGGRSGVYENMTRCDCDGDGVSSASKPAQIKKHVKKGKSDKKTKSHKLIKRT